jgi:hypothetical protein
MIETIEKRVPWTVWQVVGVIVDAYAGFVLALMIYQNWGSEKLIPVLLCIAILGGIYL